MSRFIEIQHDEWVAAGPDLVRAHYLDLQHRLEARVHPRERLRLLAPGPSGPRYERAVRHGWLTRHDLYERQLRPDGAIVDLCVSGPAWGRMLCARFWRRDEGRRPGTLVELTVTQPLPPLVGPLLARWRRRGLADELREAAGEDKVDIERGYRVDRTLRAA